MWVVRKGHEVHHDGAAYREGQTVPCTDEQAAAMPHAVERKQAAATVEAKQKRK